MTFENLPSKNSGEQTGEDAPADVDLSLPCLITKLCPILFDPMDCSTPGFPGFAVLHYLLEFAQIHVH